MPTKAGPKTKGKKKKDPKTKTRNKSKTPAPKSNKKNKKNVDISTAKTPVVNDDTTVITGINNNNNNNTSPNTPKTPKTPATLSTPKTTQPSATNRHSSQSDIKIDTDEKKDNNNNNINGSSTPQPTPSKAAQKAQKQKKRQEKKSKKSKKSGDKSTDKSKKKSSNPSKKVKDTAQNDKPKSKQAAGGTKTKKSKDTGKTGRKGVKNTKDTKDIKDSKTRTKTNKRSKTMKNVIEPGKNKKGIKSKDNKNGTRAKSDIGAVTKSKSVRNVAGSKSGNDLSLVNDNDEKDENKWQETQKFRARRKNSLMMKTAKSPITIVTVTSTSELFKMGNNNKNDAMITSGLGSSHAYHLSAISGDDSHSFLRSLSMNSIDKNKLQQILQSNGINDDVNGQDVHIIVKTTKIEHSRDLSSPANGINYSNIIRGGNIGGRGAKYDPEIYSQLEDVLKKDNINSVTGAEATQLLTGMGFYTRNNSTASGINGINGTIKFVSLNLNHSSILRAVGDGGRERENFEDLVIKSIIDNKKFITRILMCDCNLNDSFLIKILGSLEVMVFANNKIKFNDQNSIQSISTIGSNTNLEELLTMDNLMKSSSNGHLNETANITELWFEDNPIGDDAVNALADFIEKDNNIRVIKLGDNKGGRISGKSIDKIVLSIEKNKTLTKFLFDGFKLGQQKEKVEKRLERNNDLARKQQYKHLRMKSKTT